MKRTFTFAGARRKKLSALALDHDGNEIWKRDLGAFVSQHGGGQSPMVFGNPRLHHGRSGRPRKLFVRPRRQDGQNRLENSPRQDG